MADLMPWEIPDGPPQAQAMVPWDIPDAEPQAVLAPSGPPQPAPGDNSFARFNAKLDRGELQPVNAGSTFSDIGQQFRKGLVQGAGSIISAPAYAGQFLGNLAGDAVDWSTGQDSTENRKRADAIINGSLLSPRPVGEAISNSTRIGPAQTTAGQFANTIGQFIPGFLSGRPTAPATGAMLGPLLAGATASGAGSEAAGQATEGTKAEPYARLGGAMLGFAAPGALRRVVTPNVIPAERRAIIDALKKEGVPLTAGQQTGSKALRYLESELGGGKAADLMERQGQQFTKAAASKAGINSDRLTPDVMDKAFNTIGDKFSNLAKSTTVPLDKQLQDDLLAAVTDYQSIATSPAKAPEEIMSRVAELASKNGNALEGEAYKQLSSDIARYQRSASADPALKDAFSGIREALDSAVERNLSGSLLDQWKAARRDYRNLIVLEKAASAGNAAEGIITPAQLRAATVQKQGMRNYVRGKGDFSNLARAGNGILKPLPDSGTAGRTAARNLGAGLTTAIGAGIGGASGNPIMAILGALGGAAAPYAAGRALMSKPVQAYLTNQLLRGRSNVNPIVNALISGVGANTSVANSQKK